MFRPLYFIGEKKWNQQKIVFECSFIVQNQFQTILGLWKILKIFFQKIRNFYMFRPYTT